MSAKENDLLRIQEIYDVATLTLAQLELRGPSVLLLFGRLNDAAEKKRPKTSVSNTN